MNTIYFFILMWVLWLEKRDWGKTEKTIRFSWQYFYNSKREMYRSKLQDYQYRKTPEEIFGKSLDYWQDGETIHVNKGFIWVGVDLAAQDDKSLAVILTNNTITNEKKIVAELRVDGHSSAEIEKRIRDHFKKVIREHDEKIHTLISNHKMFDPSRYKK